MTPTKPTPPTIHNVTLTPGTDLFDRNGYSQRSLLAVQISNWLFDVQTYYAPTNWTFKVNRQGEYLPGESDLSPWKPEDLIVNLPFGKLRYSLSILPHPCREFDLETNFLNAYKAAATSIIAIVGPQKAGSLLKPFRLRNKNLPAPTLRFRLGGDD